MKVSVLKQASTYILTFPVTIDESEVTSIDDALFEIYQKGEMVKSIRMGSGMSFSEGSISIYMTSQDTVDFSGVYLYELWVAIDGNNYFVSEGILTFPTTKGRI